MALSAIAQIAIGRYIILPAVQGGATAAVTSGNPFILPTAPIDPTPRQAIAITLITTLALATLAFNADALLHDSTLSMSPEVSWLSISFIFSAASFPFAYEDKILGTSDFFPQVPGPDVRPLVCGKDWIRSCSALVAIFTGSTLMRTSNSFFSVLAVAYIPHLIRLSVLSKLKQARAENDPLLRTPARLRGRQLASAFVGAMSVCAIDAFVKSFPSSFINTDLLWVQRGIVGLFLLSSHSYTKAIRGVGVGKELDRNAFMTFTGILFGIPVTLCVTHFGNAFFGVFAATYVPSLVEGYMRVKRARHPQVT